MQQSRTFDPLDSIAKKRFPKQKLQPFCLRNFVCLKQSVYRQFAAETAGFDVLSENVL